MPSRDAIDERFDEIVRELRTLPGAPDSLRERVRELAAQEPPVAAREPGRWRAWLTFRSVAWTLGSAATGFVAIALAYGVVTSGGGGGDDDDSGMAAAGQTTTMAQLSPMAPPAARPPATTFDTEQAAAEDRARVAVGSATAGREAVTLPPGQRLAHHTATMRLRVSDVDELSRATREAMRVARRLGGFVASVNYAKPKGDEGDASLTLRVPTAKIQQAIAQLSDLGVIVSQRIEITDVQNRVNDTSDRILRLRRTIRRIELRLRQDVSEDERFRLQLQLEQARANLRRLTEQRASTVRRARLATIALALTTREDEEKVAPPPGRVERAARNAATVLAKELAAIVWVLIVLSPFLLLAAAAAVAGRARRRRVDERLLEQA